MAKLDSTSSTAIDQAPPKDETELRLEKLLFGDDESFLQELQTQSAEGQVKEAQLQPGQDEANVEDLADENVCAPLFQQRDTNPYGLIDVIAALLALLS